MGIKYKRQYSKINEDFTRALSKINDFYSFLGMSDDEWEELGESTQKECLKTLADDLFYALGTNQEIHVGNGMVEYDDRKNIIKLYNDENCIHIVQLT